MYIKIQVHNRGFCTYYWYLCATCLGTADVSDCESYGKKHMSGSTQQTVKMATSQASLHSASSLQPDVHPFFKVICAQLVYCMFKLLTSIS